MNTNCRSRLPQRHRIRQRSRAIHSYDVFNVLTEPDLLNVVDEQLPAHRERLFPPTTTLALFKAQTLNADASCQATIDRHVAEGIANDLSPCSTTTGAYCKARQRLPLLVCVRCCDIPAACSWMRRHTSGDGRHVQWNWWMAQPSRCPTPLTTSGATSPLSS